MRPWRFALLLVLLGVAAAALWYGRMGNREPAAAGGKPAPPQVAYDYRAQDVVLRQMGPDGRLAFEIAAAQITQLPDSGRVIANALTVYHDPPGTPVGGPNRWTLTADEGELPAEGGPVTLSGHVRARGIPVGGRIPMSIETDHLRYDMSTQQLSTDDAVRISWGDNSMQGQMLRANIGTGTVALKSVHGTFAP